MKFTTPFVLLAFLSLPLAAAAVPAAAVGQLVTDTGAKIDGLAVPSGSTILSGSSLETGQRQAVVHLTNGHLMQVAARSSVFIEQVAEDILKASVRGGVVSLQGGSGGVLHVPPGASILFAASPAPSVAPSRHVRGLVAVLISAAPTGARKLIVNDTEEIDPDLPVLITSPDRSIGEVHSLKTVGEGELELQNSLQNDYGANAMLIQGDEVRKAIAAGLVIVVGQGKSAAITAGAATTQTTVTGILLASQDSQETTASPTEPNQ